VEFALSSTVTGRPAFLYFLYFPIFLSVPIIFLYFDEIPIFSYIILTPKKCRDARMCNAMMCNASTGVLHASPTMQWSSATQCRSLGGVCTV